MSVLELIENKKQNKKGGFVYPLTVTDLNESQIQAIKSIEKNTLVCVSGAAGTGKTELIINVAIDYLAKGKKVLIVSKMDSAVNVIYDRLQHFNIPCLALRGGKKNEAINLASSLMDIIENKVDLNHTNGNIIKALFDKKEILELLRTKRVNAIKSIVADVERRKNLITIAKACLQNKKNKRDKILSEIDFNDFLNAFPCYCCTASEISNLLPLNKDMFDVAIIDETSQCDIATILPVLYRSKKAIAVGDSKQLNHISFLDSKKEQSFAVKYDIPESLQLTWKYRVNSFFDFAMFYADEHILLNTQYRMPENVFEFSNKHFYGNSIKSFKNADKEALKKVYVNSDKKYDRAINLEQAEFIIRHIQAIIKTNSNKSIAVLSPFRHQCNLIKNLIMEVIPYEKIEKHNIRVGSAYELQGMESDILLISWVINEHSHHQCTTFINNEKVLNVGITRGKEKVINFYSSEGKGLIQEYLGSIA